MYVISSVQVAPSLEVSLSLLSCLFFSCVKPSSWLHDLFSDCIVIPTAWPINFFQFLKPSSTSFSTAPLLRTTATKFCGPAAVRPRFRAVRGYAGDAAWQEPSVSYCLTTSLLHLPVYSDCFIFFSRKFALVGQSNCSFILPSVNFVRRACG